MTVCLKQSSRKERMVLINKIIKILYDKVILVYVITLMLNGCSYNQETTSIIYDYIKEQQCNSTTSTICLNDVFGVDIDTVYFFVSYQITYSAVRNITRLSEYKKNAKSDMLVGKKFDALHILFINKGKVVYEDEFYNGNNNIIFNTGSLRKKSGFGEFDGDNGFPFFLLYTSNSCMHIEMRENKYYLSCE